MTPMFKYYTAPVRENGQVVLKQGEVVDVEGEKVLLAFENEEKTRWYHRSKVDPVEGEVAAVAAGLTREKRHLARISGKEVPGVIKRLSGKKFLLHETHRVRIVESDGTDFQTPCRAESADYVNGAWEVLVRFPVRDRLGRVVKVRRRVVPANWLHPVQVPGAKGIKFTFKGEIHRRYEATSCEYDFKTIYKNKKPPEVGEDARPVPEPTGWADCGPVEKAEPRPPGNFLASLYFRQVIRRAYATSMAVTVEDHDSMARAAAEKFEKNLVEHNAGRLPRSLTDAEKFVMNNSFEQHIIDRRGHIMASKVVME